MEKETGRRPAWKVDVHEGWWRVFGHQSNNRRSHRGELECRVARKNVSPEDSKREMETKQSGDDRGVPWRKNEDDAKKDGERLKGEVVILDKDYKEKLEMEDHFLVFKRGCTQQVKTWRCSDSQRGVPRARRCSRKPARQAHTENCRKRIEEWLRGTLNAGKQHKGA